MHNLKSTVRSRLQGFRCQRGIITGSLAEGLLAVPLLIAVMTAALVFGLGISKGQAETQNRVELARNAQRPLDQMVREMRSASAIDIARTAAPGALAGQPYDVDIKAQGNNHFAVTMPQIGSSLNTFMDCPASSYGYCDGQTNRVIARQVLLPAVGSARRDVLYKCDYYVYLTARVSMGVLLVPRCYKIYSRLNSGATLTMVNPVPASMTPEAIDQTNYRCDLIYPSGGVTGTRGTGANSCSVTNTDLRSLLFDNSENASMFAKNDWVWISPRIDIFEFTSNGTAAYPGDSATLKHLQIRVSICNRDPYCSQSGFKRPLRLDASVTPRNSARLVLPDECFDDDSTNDPPVCPR